MSDHSKLAPSSASRRMACPGSRAMEERHGRDDKSEASEEGDLAHKLAAMYLKGPVDVTLQGYTDEMHAGATLYASAVSCFLPFDSQHVEERVDISSVHPECWGTPDVWGVVDEGDHVSVHIFDYKFGFTPVEAFENWQLLTYACGVVAPFQVSTVYLHIVQPRDYVSPSRHKIWAITASELDANRQRLTTSSALAMSPQPELKVSDQCKYCKARHACPALRSAAFGAAELSFRDAPQGLEPRQVGSELKLLHEARDLLDYRITALEAEATHFLQAGVAVDHYQLLPGEGRLNWAFSAKEVLKVGLLLGVDLQKEAVLTPQQAIKAGLPEDVVLKYSDRKQSLKLSKVDLNKAKEIFKKH